MYAGIRPLFAGLVATPAVFQSSVSFVGVSLISPSSECNYPYLSFAPSLAYHAATDYSKLLSPLHKCMLCNREQRNGCCPKICGDNIGEFLPHWV
jgi:hypothetical protein